MEIIQIVGIMGFFLVFGLLMIFFQFLLIRGREPDCPYEKQDYTLKELLSITGKSKLGIFELYKRLGRVPTIKEVAELKRGRRSTKIKSDAIKKEFEKYMGEK